VRLGFNSLVDPRTNSHCFEYMTDPKNQEDYPSHLPVGAGGIGELFLFWFRNF